MTVEAERERLRARCTRIQLEVRSRRSRDSGSTRSLITWRCSTPEAAQSRVPTSFGLIRSSLRGVNTLLQYTSGCPAERKRASDLWVVYRLGPRKKNASRARSGSSRNMFVPALGPGARSSSTGVSKT